VPAKLISIILSLVVTFAVGVCPCGLALFANHAAEVLSHRTAVASSLVACPACATKKSHSSNSNHNSGDSQRCASTVSGELPNFQTHAPALAALPAIMRPVAIIGTVYVPVAMFGEVEHPGLVPPPTLLNLSCCLNF
jgi:hypothetical protein